MSRRKAVLQVAESWHRGFLSWRSTYAVYVYKYTHSVCPLRTSRPWTSSRRSRQSPWTLKIHVHIYPSYITNPRCQESSFSGASWTPIDTFLTLAIESLLHRALRLVRRLNSKQHFLKRRLLQITSLAQACRTDARSAPYHRLAYGMNLPRNQ